jgi:hypothetical protein
MASELNGELAQRKQAQACYEGEGIQMQRPGRAAVK